MKLFSVLLVLPMAVKAVDSFESCGANQQLQLHKAMADSQDYVNKALTYLNSPDSNTPWYRTWFGTWDSNRQDLVRKTFNQILSSEKSGYTYDCSCINKSLDAYIPTKAPKTITLCPGFWDAGIKNPNHKAGILLRVHAARYLQPQIKDTLTQDDARKVARDNPTLSIKSPFNYEYFAENCDPTLT